MIDIVFRTNGVDTPCRLFQNPSSSLLLVFLPSVRGKPVYPYYPRISWAKDLAQFANVLYIADPFQDMSYCQSEGGSWFIGPDGRSVLLELGAWIMSLARERGFDEISLYGSSMAGYAAIGLSYYLDKCLVFAECPQLYLERHPGSRSIIDKCCGGSLDHVPTPLAAVLSLSRSSTITIAVSIYDHHYEVHALPFLSDLKKDNTPCATVNLVLYANSAYAKGHVAL